MSLRPSLGLAISMVLALVACEGDPGTVPTTDVVVQPPSYARGGGPSDPTASWLIPLADAGLALRSDGKKSDGTWSVYADGVCNVSATIFATTAGSNSGDATVKIPNTGSCKRTITLVYPDAITETIASFDNLHELENTTFAIPVGATMTRRLGIGSTRCGRVLFGQNVGANGTVGAGSDSVLVTRVDGHTWDVRSQVSPDDRALCEDTGVIYEMTVSFRIVASRDLP